MSTVFFRTLLETLDMEMNKSSGDENKSVTRVLFHFIDAWGRAYVFQKSFPNIFFFDLTTISILWYLKKVFDRNTVRNLFF